jgi:hypothetical protein
LTPSGIFLVSPSGGHSFSTTTTSGTSNLTAYTDQLDGFGNPQGTLEPLAGGRSVSASITSSNPAFGTVTTSVTITGNNDTGTATFTPVSAGTTSITIGTPSGWSTVTAAWATVTATVTQ